MKVSPVSPIDSEEQYSRRNLFISMSNRYMESPEVEDPVEKANLSNRKHAKLGIENLQEFTIFPKQVIDGKTVITA